MKGGVYIINTARGGILDTDVLIEALNSGKIAGAALDVFDTEPPDFVHPLFGMENVILTPHVSFYSVESISDLKRSTAKNVVDVLTGRWPRSVVNREVMGKTRASISNS